MNSIWIIQLFQRFGSKSPKFFKIMQIVALVIMAACGAGIYLIKNHVWVPGNTNIEGMLETILAGATGLFTAASATTSDPKLMNTKDIINVIAAADSPVIQNRIQNQVTKDNIAETTPNK